MRLIAVVLFAASFACAQQDDVAAAARANKQPQPASDSSSKVYTNDDLGYGNPKDNEKASPPKRDPFKPSTRKPDRSQQIIQQVRQQRIQIFNLEAHLARLQKIKAERAALETPPAMTTDLCANEPERCESRSAFANDLGRTQRQLVAARKKLADFQDQARKDGYPDTVVEPD